MIPKAPFSLSFHSVERKAVAQKLTTAPERRLGRGEFGAGFGKEGQTSLVEEKTRSLCCVSIKGPSTRLSPRAKKTKKRRQTMAAGRWKRHLCCCKD